MKSSIIAVIGIAVVAVIIGLVVAAQISYTIEKEPTLVQSELDAESLGNLTDLPFEFEAITAALNEKPEFDFETHDFVRFYRGVDDQGATIVDILNSRMYKNYPDIEVIMDYPHRVEWYNYIDEEKGQDYVIVGYTFQTFKEESEYIWEVYKKDMVITAKNDAAQELLDIVNSED